MKKTTRVLIVMVCVCLLTVCFAGCEKEKEEPVESVVSTVRTTVKLLDIDIPITHIELESALGFEVKEPTVTNSGSSLYTSSVDGSVSITISMTKQTIEKFDKTLPTIQDMKEAPNLGEKAFWSESYGTLFAYNKGYGISCSVMGPNLGQDEALIGSRSIVATIFGKM